MRPGFICCFHNVLACTDPVPVHTYTDTMRAERKQSDLARDRKIVVVGRFATSPKAALTPRGADGHGNDNYGPLSPYAAWFTGSAVHDADSATAGECDADDEADNAHMEEMDRRGRSRKERKIIFSRS